MKIREECEKVDASVDVIAEAGPGGTFIDKLHTAEHFRKELWFPKLLDRDYYQAWRDTGAVCLPERL